MNIDQSPIVGPMPGTPEWHELRRQLITASDFPRALGQSDYGQPLDIWLEKTGQISPFRGNDYTARGQRFEPFIAQEYEEQTEHRVIRPLPLQQHPTYQFLGATPDAVRENDPRYGVEFKACDLRRAKRLGEEGTDDVFPDWLCQCHGQMLVCGFHTVDLFVMASLHEYRLYKIERNEAMMQAMIPPLVDLWERIQSYNPPPLNFDHPRAVELCKILYPGVRRGARVDATDNIAAAWSEYNQQKEAARRAENVAAGLRAQILTFVQENQIINLPGGEREIARHVVPDVHWTMEDVRALEARVGLIKRRGHAKLIERKATKNEH